MKYPTVPLQPLGSTDCELYAGAYVARLFGRNLSVEELRPIREQQKLLIHSYLLNEIGIPGAKVSWRSDPAWANREGYKDFIFENVSKGFIGFSVIHLIPEMGHCVVLLEADSSGVTFADSVRGLVKDSWDAHLRHGNLFSPSRIDAWYYLAAEGGKE